MHYFFNICCCLSIVSSVFALSVHDPRLSPGHLEPLASGRPKIPVEVALQYPSPEDFFMKYVDKKIPLIIRGAAKSFPAFSQWSIQFFRETPEIAKMAVQVDRDKKELNNISDFRHMKLTKFLDRFQTEELFLVEGIQKPLQKYLILPSPLRCNETRKHLQDSALWYSSGKTKSLLTLTVRDEIACVIRGANEYLMLPYMKYQEKFRKIRMESKLNQVDVDRVDFGKYPELEDVEWISGHLGEGDCIYIPYKGATQVNSYAGSTKESMFVTFSFEHVHDHRPKECDIDPSQATLDKYQFSTLEMEQIKYDEAEKAVKHGNETGNDDEHYHDGSEQQEYYEERGQFIFLNFFRYLKKKESRTLNFQQFFAIMKKDSDTFTEDITNYDLPDSLQKLVREVFDMLDSNHDSLLSKGDFKQIKKSSRFLEIASDLELKMHGVQTYMDDYIELKNHHGISNEEFDAQRKARELRKKLSIHDPMEF